MGNLVEWSRNAETGVVYLIDTHVLTAFWCTLGAGLVLFALILWGLIEAEMRNKK